VKKGDKKGETKQTAISAISLKNLTGAFVVLFVGLSISFLASLVEQIASIVERNLNNRKIFHEIANELAFSASPIFSVCTLQTNFSNLDGQNLFQWFE
jgi:hypothetical protein